MTKTELERKQKRYEWRKELENGYERDIENARSRKQEEKGEVKTGPTTIETLGSYYERQLARQRAAEKR